MITDGFNVNVVLESRDDNFSSVEVFEAPYTAVWITVSHELHLTPAAARVPAAPIEVLFDNWFEYEDATFRIHLQAENGVTAANVKNIINGVNAAINDIYIPVD